MEDLYKRTDRAAAFDRVADQYARLRPGYPAELGAHIERLAGICPPAHLLEIGVGAGQATQLFHGRGYRITGVEPGAAMRNTARARLQPPENLEIEAGRFEEWDAAGRRFDLIYSGSAFHWVDPEIGYPKVAQLLTDRGALAFFWNMFPNPAGEVWDRLAEAYARNTPAIAESRGKRDYQRTIDERRQQIVATGLFGDVLVQEFPWSRRLTAEEFIGLLGTYSDHILLPEEQRQALFADISGHIASAGGFIDRPWTAVLFFAEKR